MAGAVDFLRKPISEQTLMSAIRAVVRRGRQDASRCDRRWHDVGGSRAGENRCRGSFGSRQTPADA
jgi:DNA-binding response OmpR family regulator